LATTLRPIDPFFAQPPLAVMIKKRRQQKGAGFFCPEQAKVIDLAFCGSIRGSALAWSFFRTDAEQFRDVSTAFGRPTPLLKVVVFFCFFSLIFGKFFQLVLIKSVILRGVVYGFCLKV
jgi:hypothetical protein